MRPGKRPPTFFDPVFGSPPCQLFVPAASLTLRFDGPLNSS
jgi:hypothetical protein